MHAQTTNETLTIQFSFTTKVFNANLTGLSDADSFMQPTDGGNCANWVAGHILSTRGFALALLGQQAPFSLKKYDRYKRASEPLTADEEGAKPLSEIIADFAATDEALQAGLQGLTAEIMATKAPYTPYDNDKETIGSLIAALVFHEGYHAGQLACLRYVAGAEGVIK